MSVSVSTSSQGTSDLTRFAIVERLESEYVADVFLADDTHHGRRVVLKVLPSEFAGSSDAVAQFHIDQFREEAQAATELTHPNIVQGYMGGTEQEPFVVLEYVDGPSLADILRENGPFEADELALIGAQIAAALNFAHTRGVVHGGLSPENIVVTGNTVKVAEFGLSSIRAYYGNPQDPATELSAAAYHSPEHASAAQVDAASDIYSLGAVLYAMATGAPPFSGKSTSAIDNKHLRRTPKRASRLNHSIPAALDEIIAVALMKAPADRYDSAADVCNALLPLSNTNEFGREAPDHQSREPRRLASPLSGITFQWLKEHSGVTLGTLGTVGVVAATLLFFTVVHNPVKANNGATQAYAGALPSAIAAARADYSVATPILLPDLPAQVSTTTTTPAAVAAPATKPATPATAPKAVTPVTTRPTTTTTARGQLPAPTGLQIALLQSNDILLQWNAVPNATGYVAELKNGNANGSVAFPAFDTNTTDANFGPLQPNTRYTALIWPSDATDIGGPGSNQPAATISFTNP